MADQQIMRDALSNVPGVYTLPGSARFTLKAIYADLLDNGATVDWLPCVTIYSDSGHVIAQAVDQGVKVTAGDDAQVSWFPGVKHAAAAATSAGGAHDMLMMIQRTPAQSIPNNTGTLVEFGTSVGTRFYTNAAGDFSFDVTGAGDYNGVHILAEGVYLLIAQVGFASPGNYNKQVQLVAQSSETNPIGNAGGSWVGFDTIESGGTMTSLFVLSAASATAGNNSIQVSAVQVSGGAINIAAAALTIVRLGPTFP